jgi:condensin-2 complex subunit D3
MEEAIDNFKTAASLLDHNDDESCILEHLQTLLTSIETIQHSDNSSNHEFNEEFDEEQDDETLTDLIRTSMSSYNNKQEKVSFRTLLASSDLSKELFECMSHRLEPQEEEQTDISSHWTVSQIALISARVYLELSRMGGSWGVGWIDVGIIRTCEALVRRFGEEARGKVLDFVEKKNQKKQPSKRKMTATNKIKRSRVRDSNDEDSEHNDDDYDEYGFDEVPEHEEIKPPSSPTDSIMMHGLYLMATIGHVLKGNEFWNWNKDARDGILDAAVLALGISSALSLDQSGSKNQPETLQCSDSRNHLSSGIEVCLVNRVQVTSTDDGNTTTEVDESGDVAAIQDNDKSSVSTTACPKDAVVTVLRGSYAILTYSVDLPNGTKGKASAFQSITTLTTNVLRELAKSARRKNRLSMVSFATTPCQNTRTNTSATPCLSTNNPSSTRKTPRSHRKSLDGKLNIPPSLKKTFTPNFRRSIGPSQIKQSRSMIDIFLGLMQKLCVSKGMEKADVRLRISSFIESCLEELPYAQRSIFLAFVGHLCRSKISAHRLFGVELSGNCLLMSWLWDSVGSKTLDSTHKSSPESEFPINADISGYIADDTSVTSSLLSALHGRLSDKAPAVRARAAVALSTTLKEIHRNGKKETQTRLLQSISNFRIPLLTTLRKRACVDEKATVRRACIIALVEILLFDADPNDEENVSIPDITALSQLCNDPSVSVRKVAIECVIELIFNDQNKRGNRREIAVALETAWADSVLPLIYDTENSCSTKVVDSFETLIIDPIINTVSASKMYDQALEMDSGLISAWNILSRINTSSSSTGSFKGGKNTLSVALRKLFETLEAPAQRKICMGLLKELHTAILDETESYTQTKSLSSRLIGSWCLLETLTSMESKRSTNKTGGDLSLKEAIKRSAIGTDFLVKCWDTVSSWFLHSISSNYLKVQMVSIAKSSLTVISAFAPIMSTEEAEDLCNSFSRSLRSFSIGFDIIGSTIAALGHVCLRIHEKEERQQISKAYDIWMNDLYRDCENTLSVFVMRNESISNNIEQALYTIGELAMLGFNPGNETYNESLSAIRAAKEANGNKDESVISNLRVLPSPRLTQLVQALLLPTLPAEGGSTESGNIVPSKIRALAYITFGKICLRDEAIAKDSINIFARELSLDAAVSDSAVKSNALIVLGDFCVRYTHHVDKFLPLMASCLQPSDGVSIVSSKDAMSSVIVRHHAILILSNLLLQDYIKWKGVLFYRFLAATVDEDATVANLAKLLLCGPLLTKQPTLFFNNFVDSLFILNGCTAHPMYTSRNNKDAFSYNDDSLHLFKVDSSIKRNDIYCLLLSHMSDEEKIGITARLSKEVLSAATELTGELRRAAVSNGRESRSNAYSVLSDCFEILTSPKMTISKGVQDVDEEKDTTLPAAPGPIEAQISSAKGKLLSKISRKQLIESVLPILCNLKVIFEQSRSPLLRNLMQYLVCIFRQYKKEVNETLVSNQTLLQEIKYDTKKFEKNSKHFTNFGAEDELEYRVISAVVSQDATDTEPIVG